MKLLRKIRAGESKLAWNHAATASAPESVMLSSTAFENETGIPQRYAGKGVGENVSPALSWTGVPDGTAELVLIMEDPDAPTPSPFVHCVATIQPNTDSLDEGALATSQSGVTLGKASFGQVGYLGPAPIPGHGPHHYVFQLFALDAPSGLEAKATKKGLLEAMQGHVIGRGRLVGIYER